MSDMHAFIEELDRVGRHDRQVARLRQPQQPGLAALLDGVIGAGNLDIEPAREQLHQHIGIILDRLPFGEQPRQRAIGTAGQAEEAIGSPLEIRQPYMRVIGWLNPKMRLADQRDEIAIAGGVLGIEHQRIIDWPRQRGTRPRALDSDQRADDRLHALILGRR